MNGIVCLFVLAYLASVRRDRFLLYWTGAWALLVLRFIWGGIWPSPWPHPWLGAVDTFLRLTFAGCMLAGVEELRGRRVDPRLLFGAALLYAVFCASVAQYLPGEMGRILDLGAMIAILMVASWRLGGYTPLPVAERSVTAITLAAYAFLSAIMALVPEQSALLKPVFFASLPTQMCVGMGMFALFFRTSYEAELRAERQRGATLTAALQDFLPICMHCKSIRDEQQHWKTIEQYVADRSTVRFSHGLCPTCAQTHYGESLDGSAA